MEKLHIRFMKDLRNHDFAQLFDAICNSAVKEKMNIPSITTVVERIEPHSRELLRLNHKKLQHPLTKLIEEQVNTRTEYLTCLRMSVEAKMLSHRSKERSAAQCLMYWLSPFKNKIYAPTIHRQSRMVEELMNDRKLNEKIQQATALLNLDELLKVIVKLNEKIRQNFLKRLNEKEIYSVDGLAIRDAAYNDLKMLLAFIEVTYSLCNDDDQKEQLIQLNSTIYEHIKEFRTLLRARATKKKNKKDAEFAVKELINDSSHERPQESDVNDLQLVIDSQSSYSTNPMDEDLSQSSSNIVNGVGESGIYEGLNVGELDSSERAKGHRVVHFALRT